jgi:hypothetical protein
MDIIRKVVNFAIRCHKNFVLYKIISLHTNDAVKERHPLEREGD